MWKENTHNTNYSAVVVSVVGFRLTDPSQRGEQEEHPEHQAQANGQAASCPRLHGEKLCLRIGKKRLWAKESTGVSREKKDKNRRKREDLSQCFVSSSDSQCDSREEKNQVPKNWMGDDGLKE